MILITGADRIGKTTFAKYLGEFLDLPVLGIADEVRKSFEAQIYFQSFHHLKIDCIKHTDEWKQLFKEHESKLWDWLNKNDEVKERLREDIIAFAESRKEQQGNDYWIHRMFRENKTIAARSIVHDFRFDEELYFILAQWNKRVEKHYHKVGTRREPIILRLMTEDTDLPIFTFSERMMEYIDEQGYTAIVPDPKEYEDKEEWKSIIKKAAFDFAKFVKSSFQ